MKLHYIFEDVSCEVLESPLAHINSGWYEPHYRKEVCDVEYDFDIKVSYDDVFDYLCPSDFHKWSKEEQNAYVKGFDALWDNNLVYTEDLEYDDNFYDFMKERYKEEAREAFDEEND